MSFSLIVIGSLHRVLQGLAALYQRKVHKVAVDIGIDGMD